MINLCKKEVIKMLLEGDCFDLYRNKKGKIRYKKAETQTANDRCESKKEAKKVLKVMKKLFDN